jgi:PAS domain S-box-containing protein
VRRESWERSPEIWRTACREMAQRARGGAILYPVATAFLGLASGLQRAVPKTVVAVVALAALLSAGRMVLIRYFDKIYDRHPRIWQSGFFGGLFPTCAAFSGLHCALILQRGLTTFTLFAFTLGLAFAIMAIVVYSHALKVVWTCMLVLLAPPMVALAGSDGRWISWAMAITCAYLLWAARQQHRENWAGLVARHQLALRAAELERAQVDLQNTRDALERLVAERTQALERTIEDYRRIFENAHDAIIVFRPEDEQVLNVNRRACEIYGFTREEFLQISLASISENVKRGQQQIRETLERGVYYNFESKQFRKDGSPMFLEINASAIEYEGRRAILSINRDVTERRRAEALRLAKEAAERAARAKTQFLVNMSHEIRTPMAGVIGLSDLLLATGLDKRQSEYARLIQSSAVSLLRVIDDILDFSKIEAGKLSFEDVSFDLRKTLREVVELLRLSAMAKGTSLELRVAEDLPEWVRGDPGRLRQVLMNLVGNAVKFTEGGSVCVRAEPAAGSRVHIRVEDTGIGIPAEVQGRLFELFSQGDDTTSRRFGGTGLGLAISKRIVEAMGGEIGFTSAPRAGSTFWITVDLEHAAPPGGTESPVKHPVRSRRILTAEDNPISQLVITEHLKSFGYEVTAVSNGLEALEAVQAGSYDLLLLDCQMPHLDGYEAARLIRQLPDKAGRIPIIALTAHAIREELDKCLAMGMNDTITKPFRAEVLQRTIERWLGNDAVTAPQAGAAPLEPDPDEKTLDARQFESLRAIARESGPSFLTRLLDKFSGTPYMNELRGALDRGDRAALKSRAHGLKGTSLFMGGIRLPRLCAELELLCPDAPLEECRRQVDLIEAELTNLLREFSAAIEPAPAVER